jgi:hypothetical protein
MQGGYRPPNTGQVIGGALTGMSDALMRLSSMQSDRVDRAYTLARQNRLDNQAVRRIELDSIRLNNEAMRHQYNLGQQDLARDRYRDTRADYEIEQTQDAAGSWYDMRDSGIRIRVHEMTGAPMSTAEDIIQRIQGGQPIGHLTELDPEKSQSFQTAMATDEATATALRARQQTDIAAGIDPRSGMMMDPSDVAIQQGEVYQPALGMSFDVTTPEGQNAMAQALSEIEGRKTAQQELSEEDPYRFMDDEQHLAAGQIQIMDPYTNQPRWIYPNMLQLPTTAQGYAGLDVRILQGRRPGS